LIANLNVLIFWVFKGQSWIWNPWSAWSQGR